MDDSAGVVLKKVFDVILKKVFDIDERGRDMSTLLREKPRTKTAAVDHIPTGHAQLVKLDRILHSPSEGVALFPSKQLGGVQP